MSIEIWCTVGPPDGATLTEGPFGAIDQQASRLLALEIVSLQGGPLRTACFHKVFDEFRSCIGVERGI